MSKLKEIIDKQIESNRGKNLFIDGVENTLKFNAEMLNSMVSIGHLGEDHQKLLVDYATDKAIQEFYRVNQYYSIGSKAKSDLRNIYVDFFSDIKSDGLSIDTLSKNHYRKIREWLLKTNPFAERIYSTCGAMVSPVICAEYSAEMQIDILQINFNLLIEPVLDIGCGNRGDMVNLLCSKGIDAYGIDRIAIAKDNLFSADWLEFEYGIDKWGTITSNLGFSNHFIHHHFRKESSNFIGYARKYLEILGSMKVGGSFHYAPSLPFIEKYIDSNRYEIDRRAIGETDYNMAIVKRLN